MTAPHISPLSACADVTAFAIGVGAELVVHFGGDLPIAEVLVLAAILPLLVVKGRRALRSDLRLVFILMGGWLLNQILTDIYRKTPFQDWTRGDAAIVFFALDLAFAAMLLSQNTKRRILFLVGIAVGALLQVKLQPNDMSIQYPWKFGYSTSVNLSAVLLACYFYNRRRYMLVVLVLGGISAVNLLLNYRSPVLLLMLTIVLVVPVIPEQIGQWRVLPPAGSKRRLMVLAFLAVMASLAAGGILKIISSAGYLGEEARQKNEMQAHVRGGLLLGGRPEIVASSRAVLDSPILGHGSWAKDYKYTELIYDEMYERGLDLGEDVDSIEEETEGLIPTHSHLMGAWVWAGILGGVFWAYLFWIVAKAALQLTLKPSSFAPIHIYLLLSMLWDVLFSPFGTSRRIIEAVVIVIVVDLLSQQGLVRGGISRFRPRVWRRQALHAAPAARFSPAGGTLRAR